MRSYLGYLLEKKKETNGVRQRQREKGNERHDKMGSLYEGNKERLNEAKTDIWGQLWYREQALKLPRV